LSRNSFDPRVSIVTGGASGIGLSVARELLTRGSHVVLADLNIEGAEKAAAELSASRAATSSGGSASAAALDVADLEAVKRLVVDVVAEHGRLDVMVNNAGVGVGGLTEEFTDVHWDLALGVNLGGVINGVRAAYPVMREQGFGHILNTASLAGLIPAPSMLPYTTTKHAVVGLSTALRAEAAGVGVNVSVLCPGFVDTPLLDNIYSASPAMPSAKMRQIVRGMQPRFLTPEVVGARAVRGLERNTAVITVGVLAHVLSGLNRLAPPLARKVCQLQSGVYRRRATA